VNGFIWLSVGRNWALIDVLISHEYAHKHVTFLDEGTVGF